MDASAQDTSAQDTSAQDIGVDGPPGCDVPGFIRVYGAGCDLCVPPCVSSADCSDPARPFCVVGGCQRARYCAEVDHDNVCSCAHCAAEDTLIATPEGERAIVDVAEGDLVWGARGAALVPVRVLRVSRTRVWHHHMVRITLAGGRAVEMSAGHPTAGGGRFGDLAPGASLGGAIVERSDTVPYAGSHTYDLLTDGNQGAYVAGGVLVGSTILEAHRGEALAVPPTTQPTSR
jgi:hypothetical protein